MSYQSCVYVKCCKTFSRPCRHSESTDDVRDIVRADEKRKDSELEKEENKPFDYHWFDGLFYVFYFLAGYQVSY